MAIMMTLRVTPEELKAQSNKVSTDIENVKNDIEQLKQIVKNTDAYWLGEAGNHARTNFEAGYPEMDKAVTRLGTYPTRLLQMAGIYEVTEENNDSVASAMAADVTIL